MYIHGWNGKKVEIDNTTKYQNVSLETGYGMLLSKQKNELKKYDVLYEPYENTYNVNYYVDGALEKTYNNLIPGSLIVPYEILLDESKELDGWYYDSITARKVNLESDVITGDLNLYGTLRKRVTGIFLYQYSMVFDEVGEKKN